MKAPDKIYVEICEDGIFAFPEQPFEETPAYIRKDALLEWLDAKAHIVGPYERQKAFNEVIDKLNTM